MAESSMGTDASRGQTGQVDDPALPTVDATMAGPASDVGQGTSAHGTSASAPGARFTILSRHAEGGLGRVHLARDEQLRRTVALKEIRPERADDLHVRQRFLAEAEITGQLEHPGIVPIYAIEADSVGRPVYAMRFIEGRTLAAAIAAYHARPTPLAHRDLLQKFVSVCQTLAYAHNKGVIHRDLKPANVMLGDYGETLVVDWGLAKRVSQPPTPVTRAANVTPLDARTSVSPPTVDFVPANADSNGSEQLTAAGQIVGTPAYIAPEQARGEAESTGPQADVYALGAILYEILTGQPPYRGKAVVDVLKQVCTGPPPAPIARMPRVPKPLNAVCLQAMARAPRDRYAAAADLARDVERWLADEPVAAYREPWTARISRWMRRHRTLVAAGGVLLCTATLAVTIGLILLGAAKQKTEEALNLVTVKEIQTAAALEQVKHREAGERRARRRAVDALGYLTTEVQVKIRDFPEMQQVRQELLAKALTELEEIVKEIDDRSRDQATAVTADFSINAAYIYMGDISRQIGKSRKAQEYFKVSRDILEKNLQAVPGSPKLNRNLALTLNRIGDWEYYTKNNNDEAARLYAQTLPLLARAESEMQHPENFTAEHRLEAKTIKRTRLGTYSRLATLFKERGQFPEAMKAYENCQGLLDEIEKLENAEGLTLPADDINDRHRLTTLQGETCWQMEDMPRAVPYFEKALKGYRELCQAHPGNGAFKETLASGHGRYGEFLLRLRKFKEAIATCDVAVKLADEAAKSDPNNLEAQRLLSMSLYRLGVIEDRAGEFKQSEAHLRRALEIRQRLADLEKDHESRQVDLMIALARCGQHERAAALARKLRQGGEKKFYALIQIACTYACCVEHLDKSTVSPSLRETLKPLYATAALEALQTAVANGFEGMAQLEAEEDLAAVSAHPEFKALVARARNR